MSDSEVQGATKRERTEARILRAAAELFADRGAEGVSVRDVAERAGVSHALVHRYFGSKEDLVGAAVNVARTKVSDATRNLANINDFVDAVLDLGLSDPLIARMMMRSTLERWRGTGVSPHYPVVRAGIALLKERGAPSAGVHNPAFDPRIVIAAAAALLLGWIATEPRMMDSAGIAESELDYTRTEIKRLTHVLIAASDTGAA